MVVKISVLVSYFLVVLLIGFIARTRWKATPDSYFLADRKLGTVVLLGTMVATNFSAFTVFGTSGAGYRDGYAFFPIMGFGTGFMALSFWVLGRKIWQNDYPVAMIKAMKAIIHKKAAPAEAQDIYTKEKEEKTGK